MIKFNKLSFNILALALYYMRLLMQFCRSFRLFLSPSYTKVSMKKLILCVGFSGIVLTACHKKPIIKIPTDQQLLIESIRNKNFNTTQVYVKKMRLTENSQNLIDFYISLYFDNLLTLNNTVNYLEQFYSDMNFMQQSVFKQMSHWVYLNNIYRHEISPPVRILQRQDLLLAPSNINFNLCMEDIDNKVCASNIRKKLLPFMNSEHIAKQLKKMALKDPCVNLSTKPLGRDIANRCLKKSSGDLKISLLPVPDFTYNEWLQVMRSE